MCRTIFENHAADILLPDITRYGGTSEIKKDCEPVRMF
jgi:L-alanine-DL-glutamate epimerase-like enolase superfamily enzyme